MRWSTLWRISNRKDWNKVCAVPIPGSMDPLDSAPVVAVAIGQWVIAAAPTKVRTLLGSCVGVVLYDRNARLGGVAHIVLPAAGGITDHPGKYANTAIPAMIAEFKERCGGRAAPRLTAKLIGGASMFQIDAGARGTSSLNIGQRNQEAIEQILSGLAVPIIARDVGGTSGRRLTLDTASGIVTIKVPGGADYEL
jgi:chemotaxis protein CheD